MCGFVCLWKAGDAALAQRMITKIGHRGPDAVAVVEAKDAPLVTAHCRLSIIGTEDGAQPIVSGRETLIVNGEIYNHAALRAILGPELFATQSDSETILHLFRTGQPRWIADLDGMFAFVLVSGDRILAGRDPLGIKPLYMARMGEGLAFASELKAFDGLGLKQIEAIAAGTLFDSVEGTRQWVRLPAGTAEPEPGMDVEAVRRELRYVLEAAVHKWMVADVEVGSFLSGGLDSSIMAAIAARAIAPRRLKTFAVGTAGSPDLLAARRVAAHIGAEHHEHVFTAEDIAASLKHIIYHLESADVDLVRSAIPNHFAARMARRHVKAVLTGEGADELFAGYTYHHGYVDRPRALADELTRSLGTMHNINLQRVDRISMAEGLEARTPFLDRDLIAFAQSIPATLKLRRTDPTAREATGPTTEKWILRKAVDDLLPEDIVWRKKAQFDEGSGTVAAMAEAAQHLVGTRTPLDRHREAVLYETLLRESFTEPDFVLRSSGTWIADRVA